jgi:hypothetical protein
MARARNIKPGFFTNGDLLECQPLARLLFAGLWCEADRRGILEDRPKTIKVKLLPGDNCDVDELLDELTWRGFIQRYEVDGVRCIHIKNFDKHQNPHVKETPNTLPEPVKPGASPVQAPVKNDASPADSLLPITESLLLNPDSVVTPDGDSPQPYDLLETMCESIGTDPSVLSKQDKGKQLSAAKRLVEGGVSVQDIRDVTKWLSGQSWVTSGIDLFLIEKQIGKWRLNGKPNAPPGVVDPDAAIEAWRKDARVAPDHHLRAMR